MNPINAARPSPATSYAIFGLVVSFYYSKLSTTTPGRNGNESETESKDCISYAISHFFYIEYHKENNEYVVPNFYIIKNLESVGNSPEFYTKICMVYTYCLRVQK